MRTKFAVIPELRYQLRKQLQLLRENYSKILPIRVDLYYRENTRLHEEVNNTYSTLDVRSFAEKMNSVNGVIGYNWVKEVGENRGVHFHVMLYVNGQRHQSPVKFIDTAFEVWESITENEGYVHVCEPDDSRYRVKALRMIQHWDDNAGRALRYVLDYFAKQCQKYFMDNGYQDYGISNVTPKSNRGRPRCLD